MKLSLLPACHQGSRINLNGKRPRGLGAKRIVTSGILESSIAANHSSRVCDFANATRSSASWRLNSVIAGLSHSSARDGSGLNGSKGGFMALRNGGIFASSRKVGEEYFFCIGCGFGGNVALTLQGPRSQSVRIQAA